MDPMARQAPKQQLSTTRISMTGEQAPWTLRGSLEGSAASCRSSSNSLAGPAACGKETRGQQKEKLTAPSTTPCTEGKTGFMAQSHPGFYF